MSTENLKKEVLEHARLILAASAFAWVLIWALSM